MLKRLHLLGLGLACGLVFSVMPASVPSAMAATRGASLSQQGQQGQPPQQQQAPAQQQETQQQQQMDQMQQQSQQAPSPHTKQALLTGKISMHGGHYVFEDSSSNAALTVSNPSKVKKFNGDNVKVKGTVDHIAQTIHISKIKVLAS
jgi:hypothetical protein